MRARDAQQAREIARLDEQIDVDEGAISSLLVELPREERSLDGQGRDAFVVKAQDDLPERVEPKLERGPRSRIGGTIGQAR